jgi:ISXO2-like transposase domain
VEEPGHDGGEAAEDSGASPSGETAFGISIDMSIMPNVARTGRERSGVDLTEPDERFSNCVVVGPEDRVLHDTLEAEDVQAGYSHSEGLLTSAVAVEYVNGSVQTNGLENFWSLLKRGVRGTYVSVEPFHLFRYLDEHSFRFNFREDMNDYDRLTLALSQVTGKRLTYERLTGKDREPAPTT